MFNTVLLSIIAACLFYCIISLKYNRRIKKLADFLPLSSERPHVKNREEFSTTTVAYTISLATVIVAIFELFPYMRLWLFWTVITTYFGLILVRTFIRKIWKKMNSFKKRPSLHEFLGTEFGSDRLTMIAATCTCLGFMGALAVEITVGSKFLGSLVPNTPPLFWVVLIALFVLGYVGVGGYRAVVVTERIQMYSIYGFLTALTVFLIFVALHTGFGSVKSDLGWPPHDLLPNDVGVISFLLGIFFINVPAYVADMSVWQRIGGCDDEKIATQGLRSGAIGSAVSWSWIVILAFATVLLVSNPEQKNPLFVVLQQIEQKGAFNQIILAVMVIGLLGAALSTASTQLIAAAHAIYEDIVCKLRPIPNEDQEYREIRFLRLLMVILTILTVAIIEELSRLGFTIADLVFSIFGSELSLCPPVILCLFKSGKSLHSIRYWIIAAISLGFAVGWSTAIFGKLENLPNLVFLAPVVSLGLSLFFVLVGYLIIRRRSD